MALLQVGVNLSASKDPLAAPLIKKAAAEGITLED
jgi:hypothetical protein